MDQPNYIIELKSLLSKTKRSQTKIAQELGVTHATVNRWLHLKTTPHAKAIAQIHQLYQKNIFYTQLESGFDFKKYQKKFSSLKKDHHQLEKIFTHKDVYDDYLLNLTYHTNKIEGSTLSLRETQSILFDNLVIPNHSLVEHLEVSNHRLCFQKILDSVQNQTTLTTDFILDLHKILMTGILTNAGQYRSHPVRIVGSRTAPCNYLKIPDKMTDLSEQMNSTDDPIGIIMQHAWFEEIHPFPDGNGRIGRLLLNFQLLRYGYPLVIITNEKKRIYYDTLEQAQTKKFFTPLIDFIIEEIYNP